MGGISVFQIIFFFIFCYFILISIRKICIRLFCTSKEEKYRIVLQTRMVRYIVVLIEKEDKKFSQEKADKIK